MRKNTGLTYTDIIHTSKLNLSIFIRLQSLKWMPVGQKPTYPAFFRGTLVVDQPTDTFVKLPVSLQFHFTFIVV